MTMSDQSMRARLTALVAEMRNETLVAHPVWWWADEIEALLREPPETPPSHTAPKLAPRERARRALMGIVTHADVETRVADAIVAAEDEAYKAATEEAARAAAPEEK
jgi:hypothetical protein